MQLVDITGGNAFKVACERAIGWAWQRLPTDPPDLGAFAFGSDPEVPRVGEPNVTWSALLDGATKALEVRLEHPDSRDASLTWRATVTISESGASTRATVRVERGAQVHVLRPGRTDVRAPAVVQDLMHAPLRAYAGSLELDAGARTIRADQAQGFVEDVLRVEGRALPVILAASEVHGGFLGSLTRGLAGLAQVVRAADRDADGALGEALRVYRYEVPRAGLRLYWPGFGSPSDSFRHPYWTAAQIREGRGAGRSVTSQLVHVLAPISTGMVPADPAVMEARRERLAANAGVRRERDRAQRERAREDRERRRREAQAATDGDPDESARLRAQMADLEQSLRAVEGERDTAQAQAAELEEKEDKVIIESLEIVARDEDQRRRIAMLEAENQTMKANIDALSRFEKETPLLADEDFEPVHVTCWEDVSEHLPDLVGPGFEITDRALDCADGRGRYPHPDSMWDALSRLERVGRAYNALGAKLGRRFEQFAFEEGGITVALQDNSYEQGDTYFEYQDERHSRLPHVKIDDAKAPNEVGRIYFALDSERHRLIVDWFGTKPDRPTS